MKLTKVLMFLQKQPWYRFLFPDDTQLKVECLTRVYREEDGKTIIHRKFFTLRSYLTFCFYSIFVNPIRNTRQNALDAWTIREGFTHLSPKQVWQIGAISFDATASAQSNSIDPLTFSHTVSGANRGLIVGVSTWLSGTTHDAVTYNSVSATKEKDQDYAAVNTRSSLWSLIAPATGSNTVSIDLNQAALIVGGATSFTGADQTDLVDATSGANTQSTVATHDITTINANSIVMDNVASVIGGGTLPTVGAGQTERWNLKLTAGNYHGVSSTETTTTAGVVTMSWTDYDASIFHCMASVEVKEAAAAAAGVQRPPGITGTGAFMIV